MDLRLHEKQSRAFRSAAREILYGGAAGGGKSHLKRVLAIAACVAVPGVQVYLFRRTSPDLFKNHLYGPSGFLSLLADWVLQGGVAINHSKGIITFKNGSQIHLCHCQYEKDVWHYQGAEIHLLLIDELTQFTEGQYRFLRSRVRPGALDIPDGWKHRLPGVLSGANPGGVGHNWVKAAFIEPAPPLTAWRAADDDGGMLREFIPALLEDNPTLSDADPEYEKRLEGIGDPHLVRAMRHGDWDIVAGGMFDDLWRRDVHVVAPFPIPHGWSVQRVHDWGDSKPFCTLELAESNGEDVEMPDGTRRSYPRGTMFVVGEDYGWNGKPNKGLNLTSPEIARRVVDLEGALKRQGILNGHVIQAGPGDIPDRADGRTPRDEYTKAGARFRPVTKGPGSREAGWQNIRQLLKAALAAPMEEPGLFIFDNCTHLIRTLPVLPRDERKREDIDTDAEDHAADALRYGVSKRASGPSKLGVTYA